jgi:hypothetical protein
MSLLRSDSGGKPIDAPIDFKRMMTSLTGRSNSMIDGSGNSSDQSDSGFEIFSSY